jgi:hypothetical protein
MRVWLAILTVGFGASHACAIEADAVLGTWRLAAATRKIVETGEVVDAYGGPKPDGWINYSPDGRMMVVCAFEGRDRPAANDKMSDEDRIKLHKTFFADAGTYKFEADTAVHAIDTSWNEAWTGTAQVRCVEQKGRQLIYTTTPFKFNVDGKMSIITLVWEKHP